MIVASFGDKQAEYEIVRLPVIPYKLGIILQDYDESAYTGTSWTVQARKMNDTPKIAPKGATYQVSDKWVLYMKKLMTYRAWFWWIAAEYMLMINRRSKWGTGKPDEMPRFECIALPNNFIASDSETALFARVVGRDSRFFNTDTLNPERDNWYHNPHQFWKATMHKEGQVRLVGQADHVYTPVIRQLSEQWIQKNFVEWFPKLPMNVTYNGKTHTITGYCLLGASVYGHAEHEDIPLRLARVPGELIHPCPEWRLSEKPVPV